jgi:hypothetical protein
MQQGKQFANGSIHLAAVRVRFRRTEALLNQENFPTLRRRSVRHESFSVSAMDLNTITDIARPRGRADLPAWGGRRVARWRDLSCSRSRKSASTG